jgi:serine protease Do
MTPYGRPRKKTGAGIVAAALALALFGGTVGGGATALWLYQNMPEAETETAPVSAPQIFREEPPAPAYQPSEKQPEVKPESKPVSEPVVLAESPAKEDTAPGDVTAVVEKAARSVVEITLATQVQTFFGAQESSSSGSGVVISRDGYIVTNNHVVESGGDIMIRLNDGAEYEAELIGTDAKTDLAVLKIEAEGLVPAEFADSDAVRVGEVAVVIGNPLGTLGGTVTDGIISALDRELTIDGETMNLMQTSAAVNPGNSGGGLFNAEGGLVGIVVAKSGGNGIEGLGFAIPSNLAKEVTADIMENGYVGGRPELGIRVLQIEDERTARYYGLDALGVYVAESTRPNGLESGDRIISVGGKTIEIAQDVSEAVQTGKVGDTIPVEIVRDGRKLTLEITLAEQVPESFRG